MSRTQALVLAGHGSQRHPRSAAPLHAHADRIRSRGAFDEVRTAFWKEEPALGEVRTIVESDVAFVVPLLTSEGYFADEVFPRELGVGDPDARSGSVELRYAEPVGTHDGVTDVVATRVDSVVEGPSDEVGVAVVGHGTERNARSSGATELHAERLRASNRYAEVSALFLDEAPFVEDVLAHLDATEIVVVPLFVADGHHTTEDVPAAIGHPGIDQSAAIEGRLVHYTGAVGTERRLSDVIVERAVETGAKPTDDSSLPGLSPSAEAFVRWVDASSSGRAWGELSVTRRADHYSLRHRNDADALRDALESLDDPVALREHVRHDDAGRYRPLSGARSLPTGWTLVGLDASRLVRAVRTVYPASIAHWHREQSGVLDVTDFRGTAARQTGLYADVGELGRAERSAAVEAVCGDCVRHRRWQASDDETVPGDGGIPCPEACPFFLSAAHVFAGSGAAADEFETSGTPAGALEEPGNRYRARFARALAARTGGGADGTTALASPEGEP